MRLAKDILIDYFEKLADKQKSCPIASENIAKILKILKGTQQNG